MLLVSRLPYKLAVGVTLEEYEKHSDKFNIHGYWEWVNINGDVIIYELPSKHHHHETFIATITQEITWQCSPVCRTDGRIIGLGATHKYQFINHPSLMFVISNESLFFLRNSCQQF